MTSKILATVDPDNFADMLTDLSQYIGEDQNKLGITTETAFLITEYLDKATELILAINAEREKAIEDLADLENDLDEVNVDNYLVEKVYEAGREVGVEEGIKVAEIDLWDGNVIQIEDIREVLAFHLNTTEYDPMVQRLLDGLTDRHMLYNDQTAQSALAMLARAVLGDEFFEKGNDDDE